MSGEAARRVQGLVGGRQRARRAARVGFDEVIRNVAVEVVLRHIGRGSVGVEVVPEGGKLVVVGTTVGVGVGVGGAASFRSGVVGQ